MSELVIQYMTLHPIPLNFLINEENFIFSFISVGFSEIIYSTREGKENVK
jgi:hypothetical protein